MSSPISGSSPFRRWLLPFAILLVVILALGVPGGTAAQTELERSSPQPSSVLAEPPTEILIWFTSAIDPAKSSVQVLDVNGAVLPDLAAVPGDDDRSLVVPLPDPLDNGTYTVAWSARSADDGPTTEGYFTFTVGSQVDAASVNVPRIEQPTGAPLWLQAAARWLVLLALAVAIAVWPVWLLVLWPAARGDDALAGTLARRAESLGLGAIVAALLASLLALAVQATTLTRGSLVTRIGDTLFETRYGQLWFLRVGMLLLLALALRYVPWRDPLGGKRYLTAAVAVLAILTPIPVSLGSHASDLDSGRWTAIFFDYVHLLTASLWFGGLVLLAATLVRGPAERRGVLARALPRFSAMALVCWGLLAVSGLYAWWLQAGSIEALRTTAYGQALLVKLALVAIALLIALLSLLLVTRKLGRADAAAQPRWFGRLGYAVIAEIVLTALILLAVGRMSTLPPARAVYAAEQFGQTVHFDLDGHDVVLQFAPGGAGPNHLLVTLPDDTVPIGAQALLTFTYLDRPIGSREVELGRSSLTTFETHGSDFGLAGTWETTLTVRDPGTFEWSDTQSVVVPAVGSSVPRPHWRLGTGGAIGLMLVALALVGFAVAWRAGKSRLRMESGGLGVAAAVLALILIVQGRIQPGNSYYAGLENPVAATSDSITRGSALYTANCLSCHGAAGQGDGPLSAGMYPPPANFLAPHTRAHSDGQLFDWIRNGKSNTAMPAFPDLTDEEIWDLINYIQVEFQGDPMAEGTPLASPSPIP